MQISTLLLLLLISLSFQAEYDTTKYNKCDQLRTGATYAKCNDIHIEGGYKCCFSQGYYKGEKSDICAPLSPDDYEDIDAYKKEKMEKHQDDNLTISDIQCNDLDQEKYDECDSSRTDASYEKCDTIHIDGGYKCCYSEGSYQGSTSNICAPLSESESNNIDAYIKEKETEHQDDNLKIKKITCNTIKQEKYDLCDNTRTGASFEVCDAIHIKSGYKCCYSEGYYKNAVSNICAPMSPGDYKDIDAYIKKKEAAHKDDKLDITKITCNSVDQVNYDTCDQLRTGASLDRCEQVKITGYQCCYSMGTYQGSTSNVCAPLTNAEAKDIDDYIARTEANNIDDDLHITSVDCGASKLYLAAVLLGLLTILNF